MMSRTTSTIFAATTLAALLSSCGRDADQPEPIPQQSSSPTTPTTGDSGSDDTQATGGADSGEASAGGEPTGTGATGTTGSGATDTETADAALPTVPVEYADALVIT